MSWRLQEGVNSFWNGKLVNGRYVQPLTSSRSHGSDRDAEGSDDKADDIIKHVRNERQVWHCVVFIVELVKACPFLSIGET